MEGASFEFDFDILRSSEYKILYEDTFLKIMYELWFISR
jgi:hypothetical protein